MIRRITRFISLVLSNLSKKIIFSFKSLIFKITDVILGGSLGFALLLNPILTAIFIGSTFAAWWLYQKPAVNKRKQILKIGLLLLSSLPFYFVPFSIVFEPWVFAITVSVGAIVGMFPLPRIIRKHLFPTLYALENQYLHETGNWTQVYPLILKIKENKVSVNDYVHPMALSDALIVAVMDLDEETVHKLIRLGASVNSKHSIFGTTALSRAVFQACLSESNPSENFEKSMRILNFLIEKGADINERTRNVSNTFLHIAVEIDCPTVAASLLSQGINASLVNASHQYALTSKLQDPKWREVLMAHYQSLLALKNPRNLKEIASLALDNQDYKPDATQMVLPQECLLFFKEIKQREAQRKINHANLKYYESAFVPLLENEQDSTLRQKKTSNSFQ